MKQKNRKLLRQREDRIKIFGMPTNSIRKKTRKEKKKELDKKGRKKRTESTLVVHVKNSQTIHSKLS